MLSKDANENNIRKNLYTKACLALYKSGAK